jgi:hypothetical protein
MMKKVWIGLTLMLLLAAQNMQAQETASQSPLPGIWRKYDVVPDDAPKSDDSDKLKLKEMKLVITVFHKLLREDGRFTNLAITPTSSVITGYGTYETSSKGEYVEHVEESFIYPPHTGTDLVMSCSWIDANRFMLFYEGPMGPMHEFWIRVRQPER